MIRYRLSLEIETDQDPSALLEVLEQFADDLPENCYPENSLVIDDSVTVQVLSKKIPGVMEVSDSQVSVKRGKVTIKLFGDL